MRGDVLLLMCAIACGGEQTTVNSGDPNRPVALEEWCKTLTQTMCVRAGSCIGSIEIATSCNDSAMASCMAGRPNDAPSGHNGRELGACADTMHNTPCDGYMGAVAAHTECQAK